MKTFLSAALERLRTSYWFIPSLLAAGATVLSFATVHADTVINAKWVRTTGWIWAGGPEGARNVLATIAGSTITVAGVVFSVTIVSLTLASSQFGPRLLRTFLNDRWTQVVLGIFVSTFLYCLLRSTHHPRNGRGDFRSISLRHGRSPFRGHERGLPHLLRASRLERDPGR